MPATFIRKREVQKRIGGRGCPSCGSHNTDSLRTRDGSVAAQFCFRCDFRWRPCSRRCRGYKLDATTGQIFGCRDCGVPDRVALLWPEAHRMMARVLDAEKLEGLT